MLPASSIRARFSLTGLRPASTHRAGSYTGGPGVRDRRNLYRAALAAGAIALTPSAAAAAMLDVFSPGPRLDLAAELEYRGRYLSIDDMEHDAPPPDRFGREQLGDAKARLARHYVQELGSALADEARETLPGLAELERRYDELTTFRFFPRKGAAGAGASGGAPGAAPTDGGLFRRTAAGPFRAAGPFGRPEEHDPLTVRFRFDGRMDRFAPVVEVTHGALRGRLSFDTTRESLELSLARRLWKSLDIECVGIESFGSGSSQFRLALTLPF